MQTIVHGKKQYLTLLVLSAIFILLIPLIYYIIQCIDSLLFMKNIDVPGSLQRALSIIYHVNLISAAAGSAVLIFAFVRYRFKLCLPFIAVEIFTMMSLNIISILILTEADKTELTSSLLANLTFQIALSCALIFIKLGIAKFFAKHIKNEIAAVSVIFLALSVVRVCFVNKKCTKAPEMC
jgi:membrane-associated HD superfamily phosphohydrolase